AVERALALGPGLADPLRAATRQLREALAGLTADPYAVPVLAGARGLALRLAYALAAALLIELATGAGDPVAEVAARLWVRRWLSGVDIAVEAHPHADLLSVAYPAQSRIA
ncbi:MAG: hypothetical protein ACRDT2_16655, partial [Natronosporangium sp.]